MKRTLTQLYQFVFLPVLLVGAVYVWWQSGGQLDRDAMAETTRRLSLPTVLVLCGLHLGQQLVRAFRLSVLLNQRVAWRRLISAVMLHEFFTTMLPLKAGAVSLPEVLKREGVPRSQTLAVMVAIMGLDLVAFVLPLILLAVDVRSLPMDVAALQQPLLVVCLVLVMAAAGGLFVVRRFDDWMAGKSVSDSAGPRFWVVSQLRLFLRSMAGLTRRQLAYGMLLGVLNLTIAICFSFVFVRELAPQLGWQPILVVILIMRVVGKFALQGFAGLGTNEPILVFLLCAIGLGTSESLTITVLGRAFHLGLITAGAAVGGLLLCWPSRRTLDDGQTGQSIATPIPPDCPARF